MARPRTPTCELEASEAFAHDPQRRAARENEPVPSGPLGDPPENLTAVQRAIWFELCLQVPDGVLTIADRMMVEIYCTLVARHRGGDLALDPEIDPEDENEDGSSGTTFPGRKKPPEILKAAEYNLILQLLSRMGLTPSDRSRINAPTKKKQESDDTFARLASTGRGKATEQ